MNIQGEPCRTSNLVLQVKSAIEETCPELVVECEPRYLLVLDLRLEISSMFKTCAYRETAAVTP
jgi:hypothetical protein